jgi:hypothetical protein
MLLRANPLKSAYSPPARSSWNTIQPRQRASRISKFIPVALSRWFRMRLPKRPKKTRKKKTCDWLTSRGSCVAIG